MTPFFTLVATRKFFPADQFARWTGSIVAFMGPAVKLVSAKAIYVASFRAFGRFLVLLGPTRNLKVCFPAEA